MYHREVYGFEVLYLVGAMVKWPMALAVLVVERFYQLPTPPSHGHGFVLLITWTGAFIAENLAFMSMDTESWWYHLTTVEDKVCRVLKFRLQIPTSINGNRVTMSSNHIP